MPFRQVGFLFRQAGDVVGGVAKRDELSPVRKRYWILEFALPPMFAHAAALSCLSATRAAIIDASSEAALLKHIFQNGGDFAIQ